MTLIEKVARAIWLSEPGSGTALGGDYDNKTKEFYEQRQAKAAIAVVLKELAEHGPSQITIDYLQWIARENGVDL